MYNTNKPEQQDLPSSAKLLRSTIIALGVAIALLITVILPAEYGIDPTRIGRVLGLTDMGEIKVQLAEEAAADRALDQELSETKATAQSTDLELRTETQAQATKTVSTEQSVPEPTEEWSDTRSLVLEPGEAAEIKLIMTKDAEASYEWTVSQGHLNSDLHGDNPDGQFISYRKGRSETSDADTFKAAFDGAHGWFWRNRSKADVEVTLKIRGDYTEIKRVL